MKGAMARIGIVVGVVSVILMLISCCVLPLIQVMVRRMMAMVTGQFPVSAEEEEGTEREKITVMNMRMWTTRRLLMMIFADTRI